MTTKCPNSELATNRALSDLGILPTPENRTRIFFTICIVLRLLLAGIVLHFKDNRFLPYLVLIIGLLTSYRLFNNLYGPWWWKRIYHLIISISLSTIAFLIIIKKIKHTEWMAYLLYIDVVVGFIQSLGVTRC